MGSKQWKTTSEIDGRVAAAAWHWLQVTGPGTPPPYLAAGGANLHLAKFSTFVLPLMIFGKVGLEQRWACCGNNKWGGSCVYARHDDDNGDDDR